MYRHRINKLIQHIYSGIHESVHLHCRALCSN